MRSDTIKKGMERAPHRSLLYAAGVDRADLDKPFIAVCATNRKTIEGDVISWQIVNSGQKPNMEIVKRKFNLPPCPGGGVYTLGEDGSVYCTVHNPPPIEDLQKQVTGGAGP